MLQNARIGCICITADKALPDREEPKNLTYYDSFNLPSEKNKDIPWPGGSFKSIQGL